VVEGLTLVRDCYMPMAALGSGVALWVSENGYATNLGRSEADQVANLRSTLGDLHTWSGQLNITDYRYFNLRDNVSDGTDLFDAVGLLRDDYAPKSAAAVFGALVQQYGTARPTTPDYTVARRRGRLTVSGGVPPPCTGSLAVRISAGHRVLARRRAAV